MMLTDTIAAISTATGQAGIGIVRMSGDEAIQIADKFFRPISKKTIEDSKNRTMMYGHIYDDEKLVDEVLVCKMQGPHSYTREDIVEIYCHGGIVSVRKILNLLLSAGARLADRGEFTKRAFLNGRLDLSQAEAVIDVINSKSEISYDMSIKQLEGNLSGAIKSMKEKIMRMTALIVANIDFPEDEIDMANYRRLEAEAIDVIGDIDGLLANSNRGRLIRDGINTVILGKPNVGKSSLLNAMLKDERAIVTDIPGTTRDTITDYVNLDGVLLKITDTAGIRETDDAVEKIGVDRAKKSIEESDLIIAIFDLSRELENDDYEILKLVDKRKHVILLNKIDLDRKVSEGELKDFLGDREAIEVSVERDGAKALEDKVVEMFFDGEIKETSDIYVNNVRHIESLKAAKKSMEDALNAVRGEVFMDLIEVDLEDAISNLSNITGETTTEDVLDVVFSEFCIGK
ncbi:tRNA modification GTPase [Peptoniphilus asaccharolyticus DSM 20463]|uniref:tRNA modification GTPase MnmE n=1 Tax=Peptoniphilus asaccharolyticus DSM 20463 TaxID=573058 RepID=A0A1W1V3X2_PEPAS|nr:tRNA uridine-5-carboxymethylaminomethyl(34) synthesis GTPase MnmE [Peptoniphilus asaccharolyticus]MBL7576279.1 tRNA uridine-5-carboxymethylaminomethyl(34) synthesis GTPase MnmE [Peptoniphilus asaccharolyticus]SMB88079.1 tRNA modification GTPase [Peptoniphilus asaccharolyticus DSM 20463]